MPYIRIPFTYPFLLKGAKTSEATKNAFAENSVSWQMDEKGIDARLEDKQIQGDIPRVQWHFGPKGLESKGQKVYIAADKDPAGSLQEHSQADGTNLTREESRGLIAFATSTPNLQPPQLRQQGGSTTPTLLFENVWFKDSLGHPVLFDEHQVRAKESRLNQLQRKKGGQIQISSQRVITGSGDGALDIESPFAITVTQQQTFQTEGNSCRLTTESLDVEVDEGFWKDSVLPKAKSRLEKVAAPGFSDDDFFALIPFLGDAAFRKAFQAKLAAVSQGSKEKYKEQYDAALPWIEACYQDRPADLANIKDRLSPSLYVRTINRVKHFIYVNPPRSIAIGMGIALAITGGVLAATGVLAPLGVFLFGAGAAMAAPAAVAAFSAACFGATMVLYGLAAGIAKGMKSVAKKVAIRSKRRTTAALMAKMKGEGKNPEAKSPENKTEEKISENSPLVKMNHAYLTGMGRLCTPDVIGSAWDPVPYTAKEIKEVLEGPQSMADDDIPRLDWVFGERAEVKEEKDNNVRKMREKATKIDDPASLRVYSWITPEVPVEGSRREKRTLSEALQDKAALGRLLEKMRVLKRQGFEKSMPPETELLIKYVNGGQDYQEIPFRAAVEKAIDWIEEGRKQFKTPEIPDSELENKNQASPSRDLDLSLEEARALCAYADSIGNAIPLQEGCVKGVAEGCLKRNWLQRAQRLNTEVPTVGQEPWYLEQHRLTRLSDGSIRITTNFELNAVADRDNSSIILKELDRPVIQFYAEHQLVKTQDEQFGTVFTMVPRKQKLFMDESLLTVLRERAKTRLTEITSQNVVFHVADLFAMIPYLDNQDFRSAFSKALSNQPKYVTQLADKWIGTCYRGEENTELLEAIRKDIQKDKQKFFEVSRKPKPRLTRKLSDDYFTAATAYVGYLYDDVSAEGFARALEDEMGTLKPEAYKKLRETMDNSKGTWGHKYNDFIARINIKRIVLQPAEKRPLRPNEHKVP